MRANISIWDKVWNMHIKNPNTKTSKFLACSQNFSYNNCNKEIEDNYHNDFHSFIAKHAKNDNTLDYILKNLMKIKPRYNDIF